MIDALANLGFLRVFLTFCNPAGAALRNFGEKNTLEKPSKSNICAGVTSSFLIFFV
jgi:hypothetical protein